MGFQPKQGLVYISLPKLGIITWEKSPHTHVTLKPAEASGIYVTKGTSCTLFLPKINPTAQELQGKSWKTKSRFFQWGIILEGCFSLCFLLITVPEGFCALLICCHPSEASQGHGDGKRWLYSLQDYGKSPQGKVGHTNMVSVDDNPSPIPATSKTGRKQGRPHAAKAGGEKSGMPPLQRDVSAGGDFCLTLLYQSGIWWLRPALKLCYGRQHLPALVRDTLAKK